MLEVLHVSVPPPSLWTLKLPGGLVSAPPAATALILIGDAFRNSLGASGTGQSPYSVQSLIVFTTANRGTGAVIEAVITAETGASVTLASATLGGVKRGSEMKVGNCTASCIEELDAATS